MNKRIYRKILREFERGLADAIHIYLTRPNGKDYEDVSIGILQLNVLMLLSYQADKGIIKIGKENRIVKVILKEYDYKLNKYIEFKGQINWKYKKKNVETELNQDMMLNIDLSRQSNNRLRYKIQ